MVRFAKRKNGGEKTKDERLFEYRAAVRANRQLAVALRDQGLNEEADHFAYRAQQLQRVVLRRQGLLPEVKLLQRVQISHQTIDELKLVAYPVGGMLLCAYLYS